MNSIEPSRQAAWEALEYWQSGQGWVLDGLAHTCTALDPRDRGLAYEIALGTCRRYTRLAAAVAFYSKRQPPRKIKLLLQLSLYQLFFMDRVPDHAVVDAAVKMVRHAGLGEPAVKFVNAILRRSLRDGLPPLPTKALPRLAQEYSAPICLLRRWLKTQTPQQVEERLRPALETPLQWLRLHAQKTTRDALLQALHIEPVATFGDSFIALPSGVRAITHPLFAQGHFSVQNPASALVVQLLDAQPNMHVWDACAAPGGKTALLAESVASLDLVASDIQPKRLESLQDLSARLGLNNIQTCVVDATQPPFGPEFDRILLDVPCSNLGVLGRRPEVLQRLEESSLDALPELQYTLLKAASACLKPTGVLVYATCSPELAETFAVIDRFLNEHPNFELQNASGFVDSQYVHNQCLKIPQNSNGLDQFFAARICRKQ